MKIVLVLCCIVISLSLASQVKPNAGKDRTFCYTAKKGYFISPTDISRGLSDTLGAYPSAQGGVAPYAYYWTTLEDVVDKAPKEIPATRFFNNVYMANPILKDLPYKSKLFFLTVTDSLGYKSRDTIRINISNLELVKDYFIKKTNDTLTIYQQYSGVSPQYMYWQSKSFISDTTGFQSKVWNKTTDSLKTWAVDIYGCESDTNYIKILIESGISIKEDINNFTYNVQNPVYSNTQYVLKNINEIEKMELYNINGQKIELISLKEVLEIGELLTQKGVYFLCINQKNGVKNIVKVIRQ